MMKSQIGCGLLEIIVKNLFSFIRSIVLSISSVFAIRPRTEQSPVKVSKIRKARMTTMRSVTSRAVEIFIVEYFFPGGEEVLVGDEVAALALDELDRLLVVFHQAGQVLLGKVARLQAGNLGLGCTCKLGKSHCKQITEF